jgi:hypothetical protein
MAVVGAIEVAQDFTNPAAGPIRFKILFEFIACFMAFVSLGLGVVPAFLCLWARRPKHRLGQARSLGNWSYLSGARTVGAVDDHLGRAQVAR